jgi:uncharacterized MAPEG superfamily protein
MPDLGSTEVTLLWASAALGLVHLLIAVLASVAARGMPWALGPRDEPAADMGKISARLERAYKNFLETFPLFAAAVLIEVSIGRQGGLGVLGAQLYFWGRVAYLPVYASGIPFARTAVWTIAFAGIVLVMAACLPGI